MITCSEWICFYCSKTVKKQQTLFVCHMLNMCTSTVPQQVSLWNHNWCTVNSVWLERRLIASYPTCHCDWWQFLPICDCAIMVALRSHRGEKGRPSSTSLSPWKRQSPRQHRHDVLTERWNQLFSMCILLTSRKREKQIAIHAPYARLIWSF